MDLEKSHFLPHLPGILKCEIVSTISLHMEEPGIITNSGTVMFASAHELTWGFEFADLILVAAIKVTQPLQTHKTCCFLIYIIFRWLGTLASASQSSSIFNMSVCHDGTYLLKITVLKPQWFSFT